MSLFEGWREIYTNHVACKYTRCEYLKAMFFERWTTQSRRRSTATGCSYQSSYDEPVVGFVFHF